MVKLVYNCYSLIIQIKHIMFLFIIEDMYYNGKSFKIIKFLLFFLIHKKNNLIQNIHRR